MYSPKGPPPGSKGLDRKLARAVAILQRRNTREEAPAGTWRNQVWFPAAGERRACCDRIKPPDSSSGGAKARLFEHCRTLEHVANLCGVAPRDLRRAYRAQGLRLVRSKAQQVDPPPKVLFAVPANAGWLNTRLVFQASPDEIEAWQEAATASHRELSQWVRLALSTPPLDLAQPKVLQSSRPLNIRVNEEQLRSWHAEALKARLTLSEWVRRRLNQAAQGGRL